MTAASTEPVLLRPAVPADAEELNAYVTRLTNEPHNNITRDPGQWEITVEQEREFLTKAVADPDRFVVVATVGGVIVGSANIDRRTKPTERHAAWLGVSVDAAHRHRGIGTALMRGLINWAKGRGLRRVELKVFTRNVPAIGLYLKLGFVVEGWHQRAFLKEGVWVDEYTMALLLEPSS